MAIASLLLLLASPRVCECPLVREDEPPALTSDFVPNSPAPVFRLVSDDAGIVLNWAAPGLELVCRPEKVVALSVGGGDAPEGVPGCVRERLGAAPMRLQWVPI